MQREQQSQAFMLDCFGCLVDALEVHVAVVSFSLVFSKRQRFHEAFLPVNRLSTQCVREESC